MWHHLDARAADTKTSKRFALPGAERRYAPDRQAQLAGLTVEIWLFPETRTIRGRVTMTATPLQRRNRFELDAAELRILSVSTQTGEPLAFDAHDGKVSISLSTNRSERDQVTFVIDYEGVPRRGLYFIGPTEFAPHRPFEVWTQGQDDDSRHWFPCFDQPNQKACTEVIAHIGMGQFALSNGSLIRCTEGPGERVFHYRQTIPHSPYLVSLVVGDYVAVEDTNNRVPVATYVHPHQVALAQRTFRRTATMLDFFSTKFGIPYPFERYAQICVADFIFGGMENTSATTLTELILFDERHEVELRPSAESLIAHELAHQWWGDLVTCGDWAHAWLNEGFATYAETLWREFADGQDEADYQRILDQESYFAEPYRRPLVERAFEEPIEIFDRHLYEKGACVLHLFRHLLGEDDFFSSLRHYGERHRVGSVETHDLRRAIEEATGRNLEKYFEQWVLSPGHPMLTISGHWDTRLGMFHLTVEQTQRGERTPEVFEFEAEIQVGFRTERRSEHVRVELRKQTFHIQAKERPLFVAFDPRGHITKQVDNRLPTSMLRSILEHGTYVPSAIDAARTLIKRGDPGDLSVVLQKLSSHPHYGVRVEIARALQTLPGALAQAALLGSAENDPDPRVRRAAIRALGKFSEQASAITATLLEWLSKESSDYATAEIVRTLGELRQGQARSILFEGATLREGHNHCILAARMEGLARFRDLSAAPVLIEHTSHRHPPRVRESAAYALGHLGRYAAPSGRERIQIREHLIGLLEDRWFRVRMRASDALRRLADREAASALHRQAERELDGRVKRALRIAERDIRDRSHDQEEMAHLADELRTLQQKHAQLRDRIERFEARPQHEKQRQRKKGKRSEG